MMRAALAIALVLLLALPAWAQTTIVYSRADTVAAQRAYRLVRLYEPALIDVQLLPGVPWRAAIALGICRSRVVLLVWSRRAAASTEVAREIQLAQSCAVPVVPVLLDSTPLPGDVGQLQAVDWR